MAFVCDSCHKRMNGTPKITATGRKLDQACYDQLTGLAAGVIATGSVGGAIATAGIYSRLRARRAKPTP